MEELGYIGHLVVIMGKLVLVILLELLFPEILVMVDMEQQQAAMVVMETVVLTVIQAMEQLQAILDMLVLPDMEQLPETRELPEMPEVLIQEPLE